MENHICKKCGGIAGWDSYFGLWICTRCGNEEPKPIANVDRVHAMNAEELAEWYWWMLRYVQGYTDSRVALLDWLKAES